MPQAVCVISAVFAAVELAVSDWHGLQQDELYFLVPVTTWRSASGPAAAHAARGRAHCQPRPVPG